MVILWLGGMGEMRKKYADIIWNWYIEERDNPYPSDMVMDALKWFTTYDTLPDYKYGQPWKEQLEYCSDRMNGGRARAILRLIYEAKEKEAEGYTLDEYYKCKCGVKRGGELFFKYAMDDKCEWCGAFVFGSEHVAEWKKSS